MSTLIESNLNEYITKAKSIGLSIELLNKGKSYSLLIEGVETKEHKSIEELVQNEILKDYYVTLTGAIEDI